MQKRIIQTFLSFLFLVVVVLCMPTKAQAANAPWQGITEGISYDPVSQSIIFTTIDKERSTEIYYHTVGFSIADADPATEEENSLGTFNFSLEDANIEESEAIYLDPDNKIIMTQWVIPWSFVEQKIRATPNGQAWIDKILNPIGPVYLKLDAILAVHDVSEWGDMGGWSGSYTPMFGILGTLWGKYATPEFRDYTELYTLRGWDPSHFDNHFDQYLMISIGDEDPDLPIPDPAPIRETTWGKGKPEFYTYNYSKDNQFVLGDGIPTSETVINGYEAYEWYGEAVLQSSGAEKVYNFSGNISWVEKAWVSYEGMNPEGGYYIEFPRSESYRFQVLREVAYWHTGWIALYDLNNVKDFNEVYPPIPTSTESRIRNIPYYSRITTDFDVTINGIDLSTTTQDLWEPDASWHVNWPILKGSDRTINVSADTKTDAINKFIAAAESRVPANSEIEVRNDKIRVNGKAYMSDHWYKYGDYKAEKGHINSYFDVEEEEYGLEKDETGIIIPPDVPNGKYYTDITVKYEQMIPAHHYLMISKKEAASTTLEERILEGYYQHEPIVVHTPTIAPVVIIDPDTGEELIDGGENQLIDPNVNADYQFLLDGTYTAKFIPEKHLEHFGYTGPTMDESLYNKYCKFKQVCFPFPVELYGILYEPDNSTTDADGNPKRAGYTEWINLPDFEINNFYIPTWTEEKDNYAIIFRVAPENVVDMYGVNHIDDEEWLKNATLNGEPLYNYVSYYTITAQVSGIIYGFQSVGINDRDVFGEKVTTATGKKRSNGSGIEQLIAFCDIYEEKRSGTLNREGGNSVRYTYDGTLNNEWSWKNTLPYSICRSSTNYSDGELYKGHVFTFTLRTISNLYDEDGEDYIYIKPRYTWVSADGSEIRDDIKVYGTRQIIEFGSDRDTIEYFRERGRSSIKLSERLFRGSFYYENLSMDRTIPQDDLEFSWAHANKGLYELNKDAIPTWPEEVYPSSNQYLNKEIHNHCYGTILLDHESRLLTGNLEQLERNLDKEGDELLGLGTDRDGNIITEETHPEIWYKHRESMQTWFGKYDIPNQLYIAPDTVDVWEYALEAGGINFEEDFWLRDGFLILNFDIIAVKDGVPHLTYYGGSLDRWQKEGCVETTVVSRLPNEKVVFEVHSGDVAIIDTTRSYTNRFIAGYNYISG